MPLTTVQAAKRIGVTKRRILSLIQANRIPGAHKIGHKWIVPDNFGVLPTAGDARAPHPSTKIQVDPAAEAPPPEPSPPTAIKGTSLLNGGASELLRTLRTHEQMSHSELSAATGLARSTIYKLESGQKAVTTDQFVLFVSGLGYDINIKLVRVGR